MVFVEVFTYTAYCKELKNAVFYNGINVVLKLFHTPCTDLTLTFDLENVGVILK